MAHTTFPPPSGAHAGLAHNRASNLQPARPCGSVVRVATWEITYPGISAAIEKMAPAYAAQGKVGFLRSAIGVRRYDPRPNLYLARDYADLGDRRTALEFLERSYQAHETELLYLFTDPEFDSMRSDVRFQELANRIENR